MNNEQIENMKQELQTRFGATTHLKVEFEANLDRSEYERCECEDGDCGNCDWNHMINTSDRFLSTWHRKLSSEASNAVAFSHFYYDGTVDSELTFTVPVSAVDYLPEYVRAFKDLSNETGHFDTARAGMHISVMQSSDYYVGELDEAKTANFKKQMTKMLPALYLLASSNQYSRELEYRMPRICFSSEMHNGKYSAIHLFQGGIEFRVFEPCFDRPEAILEYVSTITKCLRYYSLTAIAPTVFKRFNFRDNDDTLRRFFNTAEAMKVINETVSLIAPDNKTLSQIKQERRLPTNPRWIAKAQAKERAKYDEYVAARHEEVKSRLRRFAREIRDARRNYGVFQTDPAAFKARVKELQETYQERIVDRQEWEEQYSSDSGVSITT